MKKGDIVKLTGISKHGKNRVKELGEEWEIILTESVREENKGKIMIESLSKRSFLRWVDPKNDKNFEVEIQSV